mgnify:CR=1 FL=1
MADRDKIPVRYLFGVGIHTRYFICEANFETMACSSGYECPGWQNFALQCNITILFLMVAHTSEQSGKLLFCINMCCNSVDLQVI